MRDRLKELYQKLYELTNPVCSTKCFLPRTCCSPEYCDLAILWARAKWQETLVPTGHPRLPMMGPSGCIAPPHTRPMCTAHICEMTLYRQGQDYWNEYWKIRMDIDEIEWRFFGPMAETLVALRNAASTERKG